MTTTATATDPVASPDITTHINDRSAAPDADPSAPDPIAAATQSRARAQDAEQRANELTAELEHLRASLTETQSALRALERRAALDHALHEAQPLDTETVRILAECALETDPGADIHTTLRTLRDTKPFLFRAESPNPHAALGPMSPEPQPAPPTDPRTTALAAARKGDRSALLRYLTLRRAATDAALH